jgi:hypothetical protein
MIGTYWQGPWLYHVTVSIIGIERHRIVGERDLGRRRGGRVKKTEKILSGQLGVFGFLTKE